MASIPDSNVFKFVALRPPKPPEQRNERLAFVKDARPAKETPVGALVGQFDAADGSNVPDLTKRFIADHLYDLGYPQSAGDTRLFAVESAVKALAPEQISTNHLTSAAEAALGQPIPSYLSSPDAQKQLAGIWDHYYAFLILSLSAPQNLEQLTRNLRIYHLLDLLASNMTIQDAATLQTVLSAKVVVDPLFTSIPKPKVTVQAPKPDTIAPGTVKSYEKLWSDIVDTHRALDEVRALPLKTQVKTATRTMTQAVEGGGLPGRAKVTTANTMLRVDAASFAALHPATKVVLTALRASEANFNKPQTIDALNTKLGRLTTAMSNITDARFLDFMPQQAMEYNGIMSLATRFKDVVSQIPHFPSFPHMPAGNVRGSIRPLGIGDLKVVKQKLVKYAAGEVAHIENVLRGEYKERKYRVLDRSEEQITVSTETDEETTKDTQTTERFELKKESEKTIEEQMSVQAGVTVSGSYGMVTFGAHGDFAYSTSTQESSKSASNFAREVIDKSVSRIQKKTKEERVTKRLHEVEEIDTHGIDNKGQPDHAIGVYRWVDKYYTAQIYNYGKRMMFEFIIPEPSAFIEYAQTHQPKKDIVPPKPLPANLTHKGITESTYQTYIRDYMVQGCTPPPPEYKVAMATMASEAKIENATALAKSSKDLVAPEGYTVESLGFSLSCIYENTP